MVGLGFAQEYILFYGNGCPHCAKVQDYIKDNQITNKFDLQQKEVFFNKNNLNEFNGYLQKHNLTYDKIGVPFLIINSGEDCKYINGDINIIEYFSGRLSRRRWSPPDAPAAAAPRAARSARRRTRRPCR